MNPGRPSTDSVPPPAPAARPGAALTPSPADDPSPDGRPDGPALRLLVLMRHAHAQPWSDGGDLGRELSPAGREAATTVGRWLVAEGFRPDVVVVSPSTRTLQTWEALRRGGLRADDVWMDRALYGAEPDDLVESVNAVPDDVRTLLLLAHAPAIGELVDRLDDHTDPSPADQAARAAWEPGGAGLVVHRGPWGDFPGPGTALAAFHAP